MLTRGMLLQIFLYGNSLRSYILAVVVPSQGARPTCIPTPIPWGLANMLATTPSVSC